MAGIFVLGPKDGTAGSGWTNSDNALHDGGGAATTATLTADLVLSGFDFSGLPTSCVIKDVSIVYDAKKDETAGSGTLSLGFELSWNAGSNYTTSSNASPDLTTTETQYTENGLWGRTWSRSELQASNFRVRCRSAGSGILDTPEWVVDRLSVVVTYEDSTGLSIAHQESVRMQESSSFETGLLVWEERAGTSDGTGRSGGSFAAGIVGGDTFESIAADFQSATRAYTSRIPLAAIVSLRTAAGTTSLLLGDDHPQQIVFQPGIVEWETIQYAGAAGVEPDLAATSFVLRNTIYTDTAGTSRTIADWIRTSYFIGSTVQVYAVAVVGSATFPQIIFDGVITGYELNFAGVRVECTAQQKELGEIPSLVLQNDSMSYATSEGEEPREFGQAFPIFFGRFTPEASGLESSDNILSSSIEGSYMAASLGTRFPMIPLVLIADNFKNRVGVAPATSATSHIYGIGDRRAPLPIVADLLSPPTEYTFPFAPNVGGLDNIRGVHVFTWNSEKNRAVPFVKDISSDLPSDSQYVGAGRWSDFFAGDPTAGSAKDAQTFWVTHHAAEWPTATAPIVWGGALQSIFVSPSKLTDLAHNTAGLAWLTSATIPDAKNIVSPDLHTWATVQVGERITSRMETTAPALGEIYAVRVWVLTDLSSTCNGGQVYLRRTWNQTSVLFGNLNTTTAGGANIHGLMADPRFRRVHAFELISFRRAGYVQPQWQFTTEDFQVGLAAGTKYPYAWEIMVVPTGTGMMRILHVALEVIHKSRTSVEKDRPRVPSRLLEIGEVQWFGRSQRRFVPAPPGIRGTVDPEVRDAQTARLYTVGIGPRDQSPAKYTATASSIIENPADIAGALLDHYLADFTNRATGSAFGSFTTARTLLNTLAGGGSNIFRLSVLIPDIWTFSRVRAVLQEQARALIIKHPAGAGYQWRMFIDGPQPHVDDASRLYRGDGFLYSKLDVLEDGFSVRGSDLSDIYSRFTLRYGMHEPTGDFAATMHVSPTSSGLLSSGSTYSAALADTEARYGIQRELTVEAPWIWDPVVADAILKWHVNLRRVRREIVSFIAGPAALDLFEGHVIRLADDISEFVGYPGREGSSSWSSHYWVVVERSIETDTLQQPVVRIVAKEVYTEP